MEFITDNNTLTVQADKLVIAGWTGRDSSAVNHHIEELAALGITPPSSVPLYYQVSNKLLTQDSCIQVLGNGTSGEVEPLLLSVQNSLWLGLGSDHTDRDLEAYSVAASKQACAKPVAQQVWQFASVESHLDELILRCRIHEGDCWVIYQEGTLSSIRPLRDLLAAAQLTEDSAMLCGTLSAEGGVRPATEYAMELEDPVLGKSIKLTYSVRTLPIVS